jgi:hypothetical protein
MLWSTQGCVNGQNKEHESGIYVPGVAVGARVLLFTGGGGSRNKCCFTCLEAEDPEPEAEASPIGGFIAKTSQAVTPDFPKETKCIPICMPGSSFMHIVTYK